MGLVFLVYFLHLVGFAGQRTLQYRIHNINHVNWGTLQRIFNYLSCRQFEMTIFAQSRRVFLQEMAMIILTSGTPYCPTSARLTLYLPQRPCDSARGFLNNPSHTGFT
jgi:hypothetical protein